MAYHLSQYLRSAQAAADEPNLALFPPVTKIMDKKPT
jgi:hypothetical protein